MSYVNSFFDFIKASSDALHAVATVRARLLSEGYSELFEGDSWELSDGGKYFVIRGGSSIIAFRNRSSAGGYNLCSAHTDSPTFKVKPSISTLGAYVRLDVEKYGGAIHYTWLDRPLSVSGRVLVRCERGVESRLVKLDRDLLVIPSLAIGMKPDINSELTLNLATDLQPLFSSRDSRCDLLSIIANELSVKAEDILSHDLQLYTRQEPTLVGAEGEFILCPRFDDLSCAYCALEGFLASSDTGSIPVLALFDNEEVGSETKQGAASTFLYDVLRRISYQEETYLRRVANSFMVSCDVAHALHPAHPELSDANNAPRLGGGVVIKYNANQRYATDGEAAALFKLICDKAGVPTQSFCVRADRPCGSTLGHVSTSVVSVPTVDIGLSQLAMHSAVETGSAKDIDYMVNSIKEYYSHSLKREGEKLIIS